VHACTPPHRGENVEEAFLKTAKLIFQSVQDGRYIHPDTARLFLSLFIMHLSLTSSFAP
jgi:hypothetical protein